MAYMESGNIGEPTNNKKVSYEDKRMSGSTQYL